ncbi:histidine phosphatase superfamily [Sordaria brevicollis]|uniref:Histidine phosphatase superfamily n=1 Tax=Sordaria brevicollis TaxID=83679 RepID=A0AAE0PJL5_SORBR|nr:histidine phosphatase superfamily [Sordaria brevicollis]
MTLEVIYVTRHGFRSNWLVDHTNGSYSSTLRSPTGIAADPALTAHGVDQAKELGQRLIAADPPIERVYSSLYYRCLQTVEPFVRSAASSSSASSSVREDAERSTRHCQQGQKQLHVRGETGLGEWYGSAPFEHPVPASLATLETHFPSLLDRDYQPAVVPTRMGESVDELHDRLAVTLERLIAECDRDGIRAVLLCSHAAPIIALGRVLTGNMPENIEVEDFRAFTCGLSVFRRRKGASSGANGSDMANASANASRTKMVADSTTISSSNNTNSTLGSTSGTAKQNTKAGTDDLQGAEKSDPRQQGLHARPPVAWRGGQGVGGGWNCELNSDCSHLSQGEERGWRFSGDESFKDVPNNKSGMLDAGISLGVVVEGNKKSGNKSQTKSSTGGSRL